MESLCGNHYGEMSVDLVSRTAPEALQPLLRSGVPCGDSPPGASEPLEPCRGALVHIRHKLGHDVPVMARIMILRDGLGGRIGAAIVFHPAESLDALPHGDNSEGDAVASSQADLEERLAIVYEDFTRGGVPFGILWITVDQAQELRKTHGARACEAMLDAMEHTLRHGMRPTEELGRWGDNEFLVLSPRAHTGDARRARPGPDRPSQNGRLPLVGRSGLPHRQHWRCPGRRRRILWLNCYGGRKPQ